MFIIKPNFRLNYYINDEIHFPDFAFKAKETTIEAAAYLNYYFNRALSASFLIKNKTYAKAST